MAHREFMDRIERLSLENTELLGRIDFQREAGALETQVKWQAGIQRATELEEQMNQLIQKNQELEKLCSSQAEIIQYIRSKGSNLEEALLAELKKKEELFSELQSLKLKYEPESITKDTDKLKQAEERANQARIQNLERMFNDVKTITNI